jgi:lysophospholipase L1-like esterase
VVLACAAVFSGLALAASSGPTPFARSAATTGRETAAAPPTTTTADRLVVVGLGDSVPSASLCDCAGYVEQLGGRLGSATGRTAVVHNDAVAGWTSADVEHDLASGTTRADLAHADLVVVEVGANDFDLDRVSDPTCLPAATSTCWSDTLTALHDGLTRIVQRIRAADTNPDLRVAVVGYWNVTVDGVVGRARGRSFVAAQTGAVYVDAYSPLKGETGDRDPTNDLLDDGDHPNAGGHTLLMRAVYDALEDAGALRSWTVS